MPASGFESQFLAAIVAGRPDGDQRAPPILNDPLTLPLKSELRPNGIFHFSRLMLPVNAMQASGTPVPACATIANGDLGKWPRLRNQPEFAAESEVDVTVHERTAQVRQQLHFKLPALAEAAIAPGGQVR